MPDPEADRRAAPLPGESAPGQLSSPGCKSWTDSAARTVLPRGSDDAVDGLDAARGASIWVSARRTAVYDSAGEGPGRAMRVARTWLRLPPGLFTPQPRLAAGTRAAGRRSNTRARRARLESQARRTRDARPESRSGEGGAHRALFALRDHAALAMVAWEAYFDLAGCAAPRFERSLGLPESRGLHVGH
jgi:hypothetical protein